MNAITELVNGQVTRRYVFGPGIDEPLVWYEGSGTTNRRFLVADERGSIVAVTDSSGGLIGVNRYDEHGYPEAGNIGRFQYTGQAWVPELGLYYYKARMYAAGLGRFLQPDPLGYEDGLNLYAYVGNDPVNYSDPSGLAADDIVVTGYRLNKWDLINTLSFYDPRRWALQTIAYPLPRIGPLPPWPKGQPKVTPEAKKGICKNVAFKNWNRYAAMNNAREYRKAVGWDKDTPRQVENWLYAQYYNSATETVKGHAWLKNFGGATTALSQDALNAGLSGAAHGGEGPEQLKEWCNGNSLK